MSLEVFKVIPQASSYVYKHNSEMLTQKTLGGFSRSRRMSFSNIHKVKCSIFVNSDADNDYFWNFYDKMRENDSKFYAGVMIKNDHDLSVYEAKFVYDSVSIGQRSANNVHVISYELEIDVSSKVDLKFDEIANAYKASFVNFLDEIVNIQIDKASN